MKKVFLFFLFATISLEAQPWSGVLSTSRAVNWNNAGATIATGRTQCGSTVPAGTSAATINSDLAACSGTYLLLGAGTFNLTAGLVIPKNVTLRGSGANSTFLVFTGSVNCLGGTNIICASSSDTNYWGGPSNSASWTAGYTTGTTSITINGVSGSAPAIGNPIILDQIDTQSDNGALYVGCEIGAGTAGGDGSSTCYDGAGPNGFERGEGALSTIRGQQQIVQVTSISGSGTGPYTVGITPGLYALNWASGNSPGAWWASSPTENVGVENLSLTNNTGNAASGVNFFNCFNCWVKDVRSINTTSGTGTGWYHVSFTICNHCTVRDSYFYGNIGDTYPITTSIASDVLIENNIIQFPSQYQFFNSDCEGCVAGYNFSASQLFGTPGSANWVQQATQFHGIDLYVLSEGNIGPGFYGDSFHGTHDLDTFFRNRMDGNEQNGGYNVSSNTVAARLNTGTRYINFVGNVLGTIGYHTVYQATTSSNPNYYLSVYALGLYPEVGTSPGCGSGHVTCSDPLTQSTSMFWGNWDNVNNTSRFVSGEVPSGLSSYANPVPSSHTLPSSFYYTTIPSWWPAGKAFPIIGPDISAGNVGQCAGSGTNTYNEVTSTYSSQCTSSGGTFAAQSNTISNPAMDCYYSLGGVANGTSILNYDYSLCSSVTPGAPVTPTGLTVHIL